MKPFRSLLLPLFLLALFAGSAQAQQVNFGLTSAIGQHEVIIGQPLNQTGPGTLHIYQRSLDGTAWTLQAKLMASDGTTGDTFGQAFAIDGSTLVVTAQGQGGGQGAAYIFERDVNTGGWAETGRLSASETTALGTSVAFEGSLVVLGAAAQNEQAGTAFLFQQANDTWAEVGQLTGSDTQAGDLFGAAIKVQGDRLFIGAPGHNENAGAVYVFRYDTTTEMWNEEAKLVSGDDTLKSFGAAIQVQDNMALIGAPGMTPGTQASSPPGPGAVLAFQLDEAASTWNVQGKIQPDETPMNLFGLSISLNGDQALIGAPGVNQFSGAAHLYEYDGTSWQSTAQLTHEGEGIQIFGVSLATRGSVGVIGIPGANFGAGAAAIFARDDAGQWQKQTELAPEEEVVESVAGAQVPCENGTANQYGCNNVDLLAFVPIESLGGAEGVRLNDIWGWTDPETDREYAIVGRMDGVAFVDITNPLNPVVLGDLPLTEGANPSSWRDIKVYKDHAYVVADNAGAHGMQIFDLTQLRDVTDAPVLFEATAHYDRIFSAHNIVINEETGFAFAVGSGGGGETCGGGLHMINIQQPDNPTFAGCFADTETGRQGTGYSHDAQCVIYDGPDTEHRNKEICFGANETALSIADVTDKDNTVALSRAAYPNVGYTHQGWLTEDHSHFYMNDELDELGGKVDGTRTLIWDVTDLDDPQLVTEYISDNKASDHNLYIKGNLMYQSNYLSGLRIFDISDIANPVEVGYFDTVPGGEDAPGFGGSWSNYPYFKSGSIILTSMSEGLFIVKKREVDI